MNHLRARILAFKWLLNGTISLFDFFSLMLPLELRSTKTKSTLFGKPFFGSSATVLSQKGEIIGSNQYHIELIKDGDSVMDAGSNLGMFSVVVANKYPHCKIYAFEPTPSTFELLQENTKSYPNIVCFNLALGDICGKTFIKDYPFREICNHIADEGIPIDMKTIDSLNLPMDFLKMDTEGYEANILKGAAETIKKYKPIIAMSAYHKPEDKTELPAVLNSIVPYNCELRHDCEEDLICKPEPFIT